MSGPLRILKKLQKHFAMELSSNSSIHIIRLRDKVGWKFLTQFVFLNCCANALAHYACTPDLKNNRLTNYTFNFDQMLDIRVSITLITTKLHGMLYVQQMRLFGKASYP